MVGTTIDLLNLSKLYWDFQSKVWVYVSNGSGNLLTTHQILLYLYGLVSRISFNVQTFLQIAHVVLSDRFQLLLTIVAAEVERRTSPSILSFPFD